MAESTYYEILGIAPDATATEVKSAYRTLASRVHPDQGGPAALFFQVQEAYETLTDPTRRASYDAALAGVGPPGSADVSGGPSLGWTRVDDPPADGAGTGSTPRDPSEPSREPGTRPPADPHSGYQPPPAASQSHSPAPSGRVPAFVASHPSAALALAGLLVLWIGIGLRSGIAVLGLIAMLVGGIGLVGTRRAQRKDHLRRARMSTVDAMTGTQFEMFLEQVFLARGNRVWRSGGRGDFGADLVVDGPSGRTIVQAKRWSGVVGLAQSKRSWLHEVTTKGNTPSWPPTPTSPTTPASWPTPTRCSSGTGNASPTRSLRCLEYRNRPQRAGSVPSCVQEPRWCSGSWLSSSPRSPAEGSAQRVGGDAGDHPSCSFGQLDPDDPG